MGIGPRWQTALARSLRALRRGSTSSTAQAPQAAECKCQGPASPQLYCPTSHLDAVDVRNSQTTHLEMIPSCQLRLCLLGWRLDGLGGEIMSESTSLVSETTQATGAHTGGLFSVLPGTVLDCFLPLV